MEETQTIKAKFVADLGAFQRKADDAEEAKPIRTQPTSDEFARFFNQSLDLLCISGFDGYFKYTNPAWTTCLGWSLEVLEARPFLDLVHPDDYAATQAEMVKLAEGAETIFYENRYRHRDGSYRWLRWNAQPVPERQRIYAIARDVTRQKRLEAEILEIADQEKERLGRELHDGLCQTLAGIAALSTTLSKTLQVGRESTASAMAEEISTLLHGAISEARNLAHGLGPFDMEDIGLGGALTNLALNVQHLFNVSCSLDYDRPPREFCHEVGVHLFRIAQEAVNNAVTHGRAGHIEISLTMKNGIGLLCVRDNGVGLSETAGNPDGIGMYTMAYRARLIGGSLKVGPHARCGTEVSCEIPIHDKSTTCEDMQLVVNNL